MIGDGYLYLYQGKDSVVTVPDGVTAIGQQAFCTAQTEEVMENYWYTSLLPRDDITKIILPGSVRQIAPLAFWGLFSLTSLQLPDGLLSIGERAFAGCNTLSDLQVPSTVTDIAASAFDGIPWHSAQTDAFLILGDGILFAYQGNAAVVQVPAGVKAIGELAFSGNGQMVSLVLPDSLVRIADSALSRCTALTTRTIPEGVTQIAENAGEKSGLTTIIGVQYSAAQVFAVANGYAFSETAASQPVGESKAIRYGTDNWSFCNDETSFGNRYYLTDAATAQLETVLTDGLTLSDYTNQAWRGACYGMAVTMILAKNGALSPVMLQAGAETLHDVQATEQVQSCINYYHWTQFSQARLLDRTTNRETANQKFLRMLQMASAVETGGSPFLLEFNTASGTLHAVVGYGVEQGNWTWNGAQYDGRILLWDPNSADAFAEEICLYFDSATFQYCMPYYGVVRADDPAKNAGSLGYICNDLSVLNAVPYAAMQPQKGDVNADGVVSVADVVCLQKHLMRAASLSVAQASAADLDASGTITAMDLCLLKRTLLLHSA